VDYRCVAPGQLALAPPEARETPRADGYTPPRSARIKPGVDRDCDDPGAGCDHHESGEEGHWLEWNEEQQRPGDETDGKKAQPCCDGQAQHEREPAPARLPATVGRSPKQL